MKKFVLAADVLIHDPNAIFNFHEHEVNLPFSEYEALLGVKHSPQRDKAEDAETALNTIHSLTADRTRVEITERGINLPGRGLFKIFNSEKNKTSNYQEHPRNGRVISSLREFKSKANGNTVIFISKKAELRLKAQLIDVTAEDYMHDKVSGIDKLCPEATVIEVDKKHIINIQNRKVIDADFLEREPRSNECFKLINIQHGIVALAIYSKKRAKLLYVKHPNEFDAEKRIRPKNEEQAFEYHLATDPLIKIMVAVGNAGTGKTLMALLAAYDQLQTNIKGFGNYERIVVVRPLAEVGESMGFLPGDVNEKFAPRTMPIVSNLHLIAGSKLHSMDGLVDEKMDHSKKKISSKSEPRAIDEFLKSGHISIIPMNFLRGVTLRDCIIMFDDAQNWTSHALKTGITRAGENSKVILTGDLGQIDDPYLDASSSGLSRVLSAFSPYDFFGSLKLVKGERSYLAEVTSRIM